MADIGRSNNRILVPQARAAMDQFKMEAAREVGVTLKQGYNGDLTTRQAGSIGGQMVKKMIQAYEQQLSGGGGGQTPLG
ncbi:MAG TPA: alpha/beta-type small acid-soluble spore protein [Syntrophomonadaceae bacterium]|jgi:small acid-soluble spore protein D (minor alpha/beta-type SASP)|nr:alpha/beta-type small acid-soluble spore protein [Syntrophomonadaceae bacterium]HPU47795.1 alpha/beta-type small acid-soluble spore protein [Syntrophomonadaceae bacterium]